MRKIVSVKDENVDLENNLRIGEKEMKISETITENIFRDYYIDDNFIEKSAIPDNCGFLSKKGTGEKGYPDFFTDINNSNFSIIVEVKALIHSEAEKEIQWYLNNNTIRKTVVGMAISGQEITQLKVTYYYKQFGGEIEKFQVKDRLLSIKNIEKALNKRILGETISDEELINVIKGLNKRFHSDSKIRSTDRSLFFSGILIALTNSNFRSTYKNIMAPSDEEISTTKMTTLQSYYLNEAILTAITKQISAKINNLSKNFVWKDKFSFIRNVDYSLSDYKEIITIVRDKVYLPFKNEEKQDILGKAYKLFLSRGGKAEDKNIILTPDHIKEMMIKLARLNVNDVVLDTCMGTGGFLMEAMETMTNLSKDDEKKIQNIYENQLIGFEIDSVLFTLACSNMYLHGDGRSNLLYRSSLLYSDNNGKIMNNNDQVLFEYIKRKKPTKCIINPPYEADSSIKFTLQAIKYIEDNGKLIIIMPTPTLSKHKNALSLELLELARLDFVIKMPYNLFNEQGRTVNTSIFGFTKMPHMVDDETLFVNLKDDGFESIQHKGRIDTNNKWNDIENKVLSLINNMNEMENISKKKKIFRKINGNFELYPSGIESKKIGKNLVRLGDLFYFDKNIKQSDKLASSKNDGNGKYWFITASDEWKTHTSYTHNEEALIYAVSAGGSLGKSQYVNGKFICSNLCIILTDKKNTNYEINMKFFNEYLNYLKDEIIDSLADGTSKLTLRPEELKEYYIEYVPINEQNEFVNAHLEKFEEQKNILNKMKKNNKSKLVNILNNK